MNKVILFCILYTITSLPCLFAQTLFNKGSIRNTHYFEHIDYSLLKNKIIVRAKVNGKEGRFILDTGAPLILSKSFYYAISHDTNKSSIPVEDINGKNKALNLVTIDSINLGNLSFDHEQALLLKNDNLILKCLNIDGFLGSNLFQNSIIQFDNHSKEIIITNELKKLHLHHDNATDVALDQQKNPFIRITLPDKQKLILLFDTGADEFVTLNEQDSRNKTFSIRATGNGSSSIGVFGNGKISKSERINIPRFSLCNDIFLNTVSQTTTSNGSRIGERLLNYGIVTLDYIHKKLYFNSFSGTTINAYEQQWNLTPSFTDGKLVVGTVWDDSLNVNPGDQIIAIDGNNYSPDSPCGFLINSPLVNKKKATLKIKKSNGDIVSVNISKE